MTDEIIGRDAELSVVRDFLDRPGEGLRALVLEGEPGIGKSTIWSAGVAAARERFPHVLVSRPAETEQGLANLVLGDLFGNIGQAALTALPAPRRRAFEAALLLRDEPGQRIDPRALGAAIVTLLPLVAAGGPLVMAIDDDQWMDASSAATLGFALRRSGDLSVRLLLSRRADQVPPVSLESAADASRTQGLHVGSMSVGAIQRLLLGRLGLSFPRSSLLRLHEVSGGNPFYALELARARSTDPAQALIARWTVPPSLERLVAARLDSLDERNRLVLLLIAAHGRMTLDLLHTLRVDPSSLDVAQTANVVAMAGGTIQFTHPLLAAAAYDGPGAEARRVAHRRLAEALTDPVDRGRHVALGAAAPDDGLAETVEGAARAAHLRGMRIAAAELAAHALRLTPSVGSDRWHRRAIAAARFGLGAGHSQAARAIARDLLTQAPRGARRAEGLVLASEMEDVAAAVALLEEALVEAPRGSRLQAAIHVALAHAGRAARGRVWALAHAQEALRLSEMLGDAGLRVRALTVLGQDAFERGDPGALETIEQAYELAKSLDDPEWGDWAGSSLSFALIFSEDRDRARTWLGRELEYWQNRDEQVRYLLLWCLALVEFWSGQWTLASDYADQVREISAEYGEVPTDHLPPALIDLHRGQIASARSHSERAMELARGHILPQHLGVLAVCDLWDRKPTSALAHFIEAERAADVRGWDEPNMRWWRAEYADALLQLGRIDDATRLVDGWEAAGARLGRPHVLSQVMRCRGLIAAAQGDLTAAEALLGEAANRFHDDSDAFGRARALLALGVVRLRARQKRSARTAFTEALAGFEALGARGWIATARVELARIGGRERIEGMSPSEARVAELVAEGRTNREIASALFLGERTVASHLTHIYAKLGVRSRTELVRELLPPHARPTSENASKAPTS